VRKRVRAYAAPGMRGRGACRRERRSAGGSRRGRWGAALGGRRRGAGSRALGERALAAARTGASARGATARLVRRRAERAGGARAGGPSASGDRSKAGAGRPGVDPARHRRRWAAGAVAALAQALEQSARKRVCGHGAAGVQGWSAQTRARRRSFGGGLLRKMRERSGSQYTYATMISGWCTIGRIEDASSLAREMHEGRRAGRRGGEAKATVIARRARKEQLRSGKAVRTEVTRHGFDAQRKTGGEVAGPGGPSGIEPARSRVRAGVFCRRPTCFVSTSACVCKATDHARAS
jgi:pentatricopeptide repeat protein